MEKEAKNFCPNLLSRGENLSEFKFPETLRSQKIKNYRYNKRVWNEEIKKIEARILEMTKL